MAKSALAHTAAVRMLIASTMLATAALAMPSASWAQTNTGDSGAVAEPAHGSQDQPVRFEPVVVTATRLPQPLADVPASVSVVEALDIQGAQKTVGMEEAL